MEKRLVKELSKQMAAKDLNLDPYAKQKKIIGSDLCFSARKNIKETTVTKHQYNQLIALQRFLQENENLTQKEFNCLLKTKFLKFKFLREVNAILPDMLSKLKEHSAMYVVLSYVSAKNANKEMEKVLAEI